MGMRGLIDTSEYRAYYNAKRRCSPKAKGEDRSEYFERGIEFRFKKFSEFFKCAGLKPDPNFLLDRIDNDGHYEDGNVQWVSPSDSNKNKRMTEKRIKHNIKAAHAAGKLAAESGQAATIAHIRWHVNRGIKGDGCSLCQ